MTPIDASKKSNERLIFTNLKDKRQNQKPRDILRELVRSLILFQFLVKEIAQSIAMSFVQKPKSYTTQSLATESTV